MSDDTNACDNPLPSLPKWARLPINRCNLPPVVLGGLRFQREPEDLRLDGVRPFHDQLFRMLDTLSTPAERAERFMDYMTVHFVLEEPEEAGGDKGRKRHRTKADYTRQLRGWFFDADGREGAVIKGWVESRFGLLTRYHNGRLHTDNSEADMRFMQERARGIYNTHALDAQLDLLYTYAQYEQALIAQETGEEHITLYRGVNALGDFDILEKTGKREANVVFNSINSFTTDVDQAGMFGDHIMAVSVPRQKVFCYTELLPGKLKGENEYMVIGGAYHVRLQYW